PRRRTMNVPKQGAFDVKPRIALVAHDVHDRGGMERALAELLRRGADRVDFVVIASSLAEDLRPLAEWRRVPLPRRPFPLKFVCFFVLGAVRLVGVARDAV